MKNKGIMNIIKIGCFILGIIIVGFNFGIIAKDILDEQKAIKIEAKISSLEFEGNKLSAKISYEVENEIYETSYKLVDENYAVGDKVTIKYNKDNPSQLINNNHIILYVVSLLIVIVLLKISFTYMLKSLKVSKKAKYLKANGILMNVPILDVYNNKRKNKFYYIVRLKYVNSQDNTSYIFESEETLVNLKNNIDVRGITSLPVYVDSNNMASYYVDISSIL